MKIITKTLVCLALLLPYKYSIAIDYKTDIFNDDNSVIPTAYMCAVTAQKNGFDAEAVQVLGSMLKAHKISPKLRGDLMSDAITWYQSVKGSFNFTDYWNNECKQPFENMKFLYKKSSR